MLGLLIIVLLSLAANSQEPSAQTDKPQVKINYLNVCTPSDSDKQELASALSRIPARPKFTPDFEVSRGRSSASEPPVAIAETALPGSVANIGQMSNWVRVRREFPTDSPFISVQYTLSTAGRGGAETLVFRARDPKEILQILLEAKASSADPNTFLTTDTPAERIRLERYGKSSVALARCPTADQAAYEAIFREGSSVLAHYRSALDVRRIVPGDLRRLGTLNNKPSAPAPKKRKAMPTQSSTPLRSQ
jgi:hypothetical protein